MSSERRKPCKHWNGNARRKLCALLAQRRPYAEIAAELGVTRLAVARAIERMRKAPGGETVPRLRRPRRFAGTPQQNGVTL
jgi:biotin operon repressor